MKVLMSLAGLLLIALGVAIVLGFVQLTEQRELLSIGTWSASMERERPVPSWLGIASLVAGGGLLAAGLLRGKRR